MFKKFSFITILFLSAQNVFPWSELNSGVTTPLTSVSAIYKNSKHVVWVCGNNGTVLKSINSGNDFSNVSGNGIPSNVQLVNIYAVSMFTALTAGNIGSTTYVYRTTNGGLNWVQVFSQSNGFINAVTMKGLNDTANGFMQGNPVGGRWSLWKTTNCGLTWDSSSLYLSQASGETGWKNSLARLSNNLWFGTNNNRIYYSTNFGLNWNHSQSASDLNIYTIHVTYLDGTLYAGGQNLLRSNNLGQNWTVIPSSGTGNFTGIWGPVSYECWAVGDGQNVFYSQLTNWGVHYTAPSGNYTHMDGDLDPTSDNSLSLVGYLYAVRNNGGISRHQWFIAGISQISSEIPAGFSLNQNYPNPFNPVTSFSFDIPVDSYVRLTVLDVTGREIETLADRNLKAGKYQSQWDASSYSSGVYFCRMITDNFQQTIKMILTK